MNSCLFRWDVGNAEKITKLNMELATVNDRVLNFSKTATRLEDQFKKMESKYEEQLKLEERTNELNKRFAERKQEQDKVRRVTPNIFESIKFPKCLSICDR